jgi:hypothetical protein
MAYFGVLSPDKFIPERCMSSAGLDCIDKASITKDGTLIFALKNQLGMDIDILQDISVQQGCNAQTVSTINGFGSFPVTIQNGEVMAIKIECGKVRDDSFKTSFKLNYINKATGIEHTSDISISGTPR